jgi:hypothetical protein
MKATRITEARTFTDLPNIGPAMAADFMLLGFAHPAELAGQDPLSLYRRLEGMTGGYQDPCVLDTFMAAVAFAEGGPAMPWFAFTAARKRAHPKPHG